MCTGRSSNTLTSSTRRSRSCIGGLGIDKVGRRLMSDYRFLAQYCPCLSPMVINLGGPSDETAKSNVLCHDRTGTIKIPPCSVTVRAAVPSVHLNYRSPLPSPHTRDKYPRAERKNNQSINQSIPVVTLHFNRSVGRKL